MDGKKERCRPALIRIPSESILGSTMLPKIEAVTNYESKSEEDEDVEFGSIGGTDSGRSQFGYRLY